MSDHAPQAFGTDIKCRLTEMKCFFNNLLSVYTMYTVKYHLQFVVSIPFYETELTIGTCASNLRDLRCLNCDQHSCPNHSIKFTSQRVYIIQSHKVFLFVFVRKITCYKVRIIYGVTHFHGKQILFCTREKPELRRMRIIKGSDNSRVPNIHATPAVLNHAQLSGSWMEGKKGCEDRRERGCEGNGLI